MFRSIDVNEISSPTSWGELRGWLLSVCVCIHCEPSGDIYCYYRHHLQEIEEYLLQQDIPYYVRQAKDYWLVKYDKEAL